MLEEERVGESLGQAQHLARRGEGATLDCRGHDRAEAGLEPEVLRHHRERPAVGRQHHRVGKVAARHLRQPPHHPGLEAPDQPVDGPVDDAYRPLLLDRFGGEQARDVAHRGRPQPPRAGSLRRPPRAGRLPRQLDPERQRPRVPRRPVRYPAQQLAPRGDGREGEQPQRALLDDTHRPVGRHRQQPHDDVAAPGQERRLAQGISPAGPSSSAPGTTGRRAPLRPRRTAAHPEMESTRVGLVASSPSGSSGPRRPEELRPTSHRSAQHVADAARARRSAPPPRPVAHPLAEGAGPHVRRVRRNFAAAAGEGLRHDLGRGLPRTPACRGRLRLPTSGVAASPLMSRFPPASIGAGLQQPRPAGVATALLGRRPPGSVSVSRRNDRGSSEKEALPVPVLCEPCCVASREPCWPVVCPLDEP